MPKILVEINIPLPLMSLFESEGDVIHENGPNYGVRLFRFKADTDQKTRLAVECMLAHILQIRRDGDLEANGRRVDSEVIRESQLEEIRKIGALAMGVSVERFREMLTDDSKPESATEQAKRMSEGETWNPLHDEVEYYDNPENQ